jgi:hypothetical protein
MRKWLVIAGVVCVALVITFLIGFGFLTLKTRGTASAPQQHVLVSQNVANTQNITNSSFADLPESAIPGRYRYISGDKDYIIILYEDHSFKNKDGTVLPVHRWDLTPEGLVLQWIQNKSLYDRIEAPGIYTGTKEDGTTRRLEKQVSTDPAELVKPTAL